MNGSLEVWKDCGVVLFNNDIDRRTAATRMARRLPNLVVEHPKNGILRPLTN